LKVAQAQFDVEVALLIFKTSSRLGLPARAAYILEPEHNVRNTFDRSWLAKLGSRRCVRLRRVVSPGMISKGRCFQTRPHRFASLQGCYLRKVPVGTLLQGSNELRKPSTLATRHTSFAMSHWSSQCVADFARHEEFYFNQVSHRPLV
jgi:hypothetical protein